MDQAQMHGLIAGIYDAALEPGRWPAVLGEIGESIGAAAATIAILDGAGICKHLIAAGIPEEYKSRFLTEFSLPERNPLAGIAPLTPLGVPVFAAQVLGVKQWTASQLYQEMYRPMGFYNGVAIMLAKGRQFNIGFSPQLPHKKETFELDERLRFDALIPHLQRALSLFVRFEAVAGKNRILTEALDRVTSAGVVLLDGTGAVILANRMAEEIASQCDGFAIGRAGVTAATPELTRQLQQAIAAAAQTAAGDGLSAGGTLRLARPSGRRPLLAIVSPVGAAEWGLIPRRPAAILLICDPEREVALPPERLSRLFGLTRREAQIAALLAQGAGLSDAAERLGLSRGTVQTHLKRILEKTDTHRQAELVSLLLRALAGVGR